MSLKTSFFNKSIFKSDMKRFWWIGALETVIICLACVLTFYMNCERAIAMDMAGSVPEWLGAILILGVFSMGVITMLLSYMHFTASVSSHHSIPVKRETLLTTKLVSTVVLTVIPVIINAVILALMLTKPEYREFYGMSDVLNWAWTGILYTIVIMSLTTAVNMMTGNPIGTLVFTPGFLFLPLAVYGFKEMFCEYELYGYVSPQNDFLNYIYISQENLKNFKYSAIYLVMAAVFIALAYVLYRKRKLESHGEVISFTWLKPVFIGVVAILSSMVSYVYAVGFLDIINEFMVIPLGLAGTVIAVMASRKKISLRGTLKPVLIYTAAALVFCGMVKFDIFGYETRIPNIDDIAKVTIINGPDGGNGLMVNGTLLKYKGRDGDEGYFTEREDIENVIELHKHMVSMRRKKNDYAYTFPIEYTLKDGRKMMRRYSVDMAEEADYMKPLYETDTLREYSFPVINSEVKNFYKISISDRRVGDTTIYPDSAYMQKLIDAFEKDARSATYEEFVLNDGASTMIDFYYEREFDYDEEELKKIIPEFNGITQINRGYYVRSGYKNTIAVLKEMGYYDTLPKGEDIASAQINVEKSYDALSYEKTHSEDVAEQCDVTVTDPQELAEFYKLYDNMIEVTKYSPGQTNIDVYISYTLKSGNEFAVSCTYDENKLPEIFKKYIK